MDYVSTGQTAKETYLIKLKYMETKLLMKGKLISIQSGRMNV